MHWLVIAVVVFIVYKLVSNELRARAERTEKTTSGAAVPQNETQDPVCGVFIDESTSVSIRDGETIYRFCSYECRDEYLQRLQAAGRIIPTTKE